MFLVRDARRVGPARLQGLEEIETIVRPLADVPGLVRGGLITHSLVVCAFGFYFLREAPTRT
jgi:hypothetical protein